MRVIKKDEIIKGIDFSIPYYQRLQGLALHLGENKEDESVLTHLETVLILINTLDEAAEKQGLIEELNVVPSKE